MSLFDMSLVFNHAAPAAELELQTLASSEDQWIAMKRYGRPVKPALRRHGHGSCRPKTLSRERLAWGLFDSMVLVPFCLSIATNPRSVSGGLDWPLRCEVQAYGQLGYVGCLAK